VYTDISETEGKHLKGLEMKVDIYFNITKKIFSVRRGGRVVGHLDRVFLMNAKFVVSQKGMKRVRKDMVKNVHAVIRGELVPEFTGVDGVEVAYNPYKHCTFVQRESGDAVFDANYVQMAVIDGKPVVKSFTEKVSEKACTMSIL
jgi:hypothetical protein|tara:strand:- start:1905 stop:2339 length:435 start_codon:yes stop_codon:yes gene_type:complete